MHNPLLARGLMLWRIVPFSEKLNFLRGKHITSGYISRPLFGKIDLY